MMTDDAAFGPSELDLNGEAVSARDLGLWGDEGILEPAWEAMEQADTATQFYRAAAVLIFHARHLNPSLHARIARLIQAPFKRAAHAPPKWQRHEEIVWAIGNGPGAVGQNVIAFHEWEGLPRKQVIWLIQQRYGLTEDAAAKAYSAARRTVRERVSGAAGEEGN